MNRTKKYDIPLANDSVDFVRAFDFIHPKALAYDGVEKPRYVDTLANIKGEVTAKVKIYNDTPEFPRCKSLR